MVENKIKIGDLAVWFEGEGSWRVDDIKDGFVFLSPWPNDGQNIKVSIEEFDNDFEKIWYDSNLEIGEKFISKTDMKITDEINVSSGEVWEVIKMFEVFVKIEKDDKSFWIDDKTFVENFEKVQS